MTRTTDDEEKKSGEAQHAPNKKAALRVVGVDHGTDDRTVAVVCSGSTFSMIPKMHASPTIINKPEPNGLNYSCDVIFRESIVTGWQTFCTARGDTREIARMRAELVAGAINARTKND